MSRITITGGNRFHAQYRPSRRDHREVIQPMSLPRPWWRDRFPLLVAGVTAAIFVAQGIRWILAI